LVVVLTVMACGNAWAGGLRDCPSCPEMVPLPAGGFMMGPAAGEEEREHVPAADRDGPLHRVSIAAFAIGKYEVTVAEYAAFAAATRRPESASCWAYGPTGKWLDVRGRSWRKPGFQQGDSDPVVCVSWHDAEAYIAWLRQTTGKAYRLPSEAEWEYAARAGTQTARFWGDARAKACQYGNFADLTGAETMRWSKKPENLFMCEDGHAYTAKVGSYKPNGFGLHDMLGNVWEWVSDCFNKTYTGAPANGAAWQSGDCQQRMLRGGAWYVAPPSARSAFRGNDRPDNHMSHLGFRVARGN
jgi:sulfatase modifying factor 1